MQPFGSEAPGRGWAIAQAGGVGEHIPAPLSPQDRLSQLHIHTLPTLLCLGETSEVAEHICGVTTGLFSPFLALHWDPFPSFLLLVRSCWKTQSLYVATQRKTMKYLPREYDSFS